MNLLDARRRAPRISVDGFCGVATDDDLACASLSNLSMLGLRIERPFDPRAKRDDVLQLEIELPGLDEVVWASAVVTRAHLSPRGRHPDGQPKFWCRAGLAIRDTSRRERRMLHDYIIDKLVDRVPIPDRRSSSSSR